ncbi:uncharacterized protein LOC127733065 [Mytilus californianus]|uniref:uncharacterized protein LOC127733065 n=1 Tax=Mytilus californianus TaxID=6549 RepID=UPI0022468E06|nr:uncharacterized protein LOC127733065 [Mytilus californianus]XP_052098292.1 uncharacterized protein LOC127733065 [Mytilus californianus]
MYGYDTENASLPANATINVNGTTVTLSESKPYDEPPSWRTRVTLTTCHTDSSKLDGIHRNIVSLFEGRNLHSNLVQLWKELKKQYNAVLQKLLTQVGSHQIILDMYMFSKRGHESYKREVSDGRFSRILVLLFEEMSEGNIDSTDTSFNVRTERDEKFTDPTPPASPTSTTISIGEQSVDSFSSFSESMAFGGFPDDPYGTMQEFLESTPTESPSVSPIKDIQRHDMRRTVMLVETGAQTNAGVSEMLGPVPLSSRQMQQMKNQLEASMTRRLTDVKNTQAKDKMDIVRRIDKLEKNIKQSNETSELMLASQKTAVDEGLDRTRRTLQGLSEKVDDMERMFEEKLQLMTETKSGQRDTEKIQDLTQEVKDFRKNFDMYQQETTKRLDLVVNTITEVKTAVEKSSLDIKEALTRFTNLKPLPISPPSSPRSDIHVHLQSSRRPEPHDPSSTLPKTLSHADSHLSSTRLSESTQRVDQPQDSDDFSSMGRQGIRLGAEMLFQRDDNVNNVHSTSTQDYIKLSEQRQRSEMQSDIGRTSTSLLPKTPPELEEALKFAEEEGILPKIGLEEENLQIEERESAHLPTVEGATAFTDEHMYDNGQTEPLSPLSTHGTEPSLNGDPQPIQDEQTIMTEVQRTTHADEGVILEANELRRFADLPMTETILKILVKALQDAKSNVPDTSDGGIDTILCLDISQSTEGKAFDQLISVLIDFLNDAEELSLNRELYENIGIVVFGSQTEILSPLTMDYSDLVTKICKLKPRGTSALHTALALCSIALKEKGGPMSMGGYIVPSRIVVFSDGRPTDDSQMNDILSEYAPKPPEIGERVKVMVEQLHHQGYTLFTVPVGSHVNRMFLQDMAKMGGGKLIDMEDVRFIKKYFHYQVVTGNVIQKCHETGNTKMYAEYIQREVNQHESGLDSDDISHITEIIHTSKELDDEEHDNLPSLGSRVQILSGEATSEPLQYGTTVQNLPDGWIKVQLDNGLINFYHYVNGDKEDVKLVSVPRQLKEDQLIEVGVFVCEIGKPQRKGIVFRVTNSGFVDVRWEDGTKSRHKYGADGEFQLEIHNEVSNTKVLWKWQALSMQQWISFDDVNQTKIEQAYKKKSKTCVIDMDNNRARIVFDKGHMKFMGEDNIILPVRRFDDS